ncbi:MAG: UTP--glucose-1-phosphate uridylyltransferase [Verrucomicrobiales bacterium]|nr:UTP--glucose-1-phosphate uridylyltransferase [Verrucomicrobiales bacterium]MCP5526634.1 UTP--glucose-1-phosphate uridylyltransferase [Verrucomicrobiales bacterium]
MEIKKAIITAAGRNQRTLPLQVFIDRDGVQRTALGILVEEVLSAGVEEVAVIVHAGDAENYRSSVDAHDGRVRFLEQPAPLGYGHAVSLGAPFVGDRPFMLLVGDHLAISRASISCASQLVQAAAAEDCAVSTVQATHERLLHAYGVVGGNPLPGKPGLFSVETVIEKPTPTEAEQRLMVPGLRAGYYLCFFGMHVLTPTLMGILSDLMREAGDARRAHLSEALAMLGGRERYLAFEVQGSRYDIGARHGLLTAQLALALEGRDRDEVLTMLVELLARERRG